MRSHLHHVFRHVAVHATADREYEAFLELLLLVMMIDGKVSTDELDEIRAIAQDHGLETDTFSLDQHLGPASARVRGALAEAGGVDGLLDEISERVTSKVLRASLVAAANDVATADELVDDDESTLLMAIKSRFG